MKTVLITGASHGIGKAIAKAFAQSGYALYLNCRRSGDECTAYAKELSKEYHVPCKAIIGDVADYTQVVRIFEKIGKDQGTDYPDIDVLVNNAGIAHIGLIQDMTIEEWNRIINTNLTSVFSCCKLAIPNMISKKSGKIINISSVWGNVGASCEAAYSASKGGMNTFTKALAKELAPSNIQVNAIACGVIDTRMNAGFSEEDRENLKDEIPAGRFGTPEEVADMALILAMSSSYLTGQIITMDGGWT